MTFMSRLLMGLILMTGLLTNAQAQTKLKEAFKDSFITLNVELQAKLNPYANGLPDAVQQALTRRYADLFTIYLKHRDVIDRVTFWGVADGDSWLNNWPVKGRTSYPLLFDREDKPKPAFNAVIQVSQQKAATN